MRSRCSVRRPLMCGSCCCWVSRAYCSKAPAAQIAAGSRSSPKPARSWVLNWRVNCSRALSSSKCQGGRRVMPGCARVSNGLSSGMSNSAARSRANSPLSASRSVNCMALKRPLLSSSQARPVVSRCCASAASRVSWRASSKASSLTVPGVTTRTIRRSTGPLAAVGSPTCSAMATDSPSRTSLPRYDSAAW